MYRRMATIKVVKNKRPDVMPIASCWCVLWMTSILPDSEMEPPPYELQRLSQENQDSCNCYSGDLFSLGTVEWLLEAVWSC